MIIISECPACNEKQPIEANQQWFELYTKESEVGVMPAHCTKCYASWEYHYKLESIESIELAEN